MFITPDKLRPFYDEVESQLAQEKRFTFIEKRQLADDLDFTGNILKTARRRAHQKLAPTIPGGNEYGYQTARDAGQWWLYAKTWLNEVIEQTEEIDDALARQLAAYSGQLQEDNVQLLDLNYPYFRTFAALTALRRQREERGEWIPDPFDQENQAGCFVLANTIDVISESRGGQDNSPVEKVFPDDRYGLRYVVTPSRTVFANQYVIDVFLPDRQPEFDATNREKPSLTYTLSENDEADMVVSREPSSEAEDQLSLPLKTSLSMAAAFMADLNDEQIDEIFKRTELSLTGF